MTGTVTSSGRGGTAAAMTRNEQTAEEHSTLEQQSPGRLDHPAWCVVLTMESMTSVALKHSEDAGMNLRRRSGGGYQRGMIDRAVPLR